MSELIRLMRLTSPDRNGWVPSSMPHKSPRVDEPQDPAVEGVPPIQYDEGDGTGYGRSLFEDAVPPPLKMIPHEDDEPMRKIPRRYGSQTT